MTLPATAIASAPPLAAGAPTAIAGPRDDGDVAWGMLSTSAEGVLIKANARFAGWCSLPPQALVGRKLSELVTPASRIMLQTHFVPMLRVQGYANEIALDLVDANRQRLPILISAVRNGDRTDITAFDASAIRRHERELVQARHAAEQAAQSLAQVNDRLLARSEELVLTLQSIADAVVTTDGAGRITSMNPAALGLAAQPLDALLGSNIAGFGQLFTTQGERRPVAWQTSWSRPVRAARALELQRADGSCRLVSATVAPLRDSAGVVSGVVWVGRDVTEEHRAAQRRAHEADHDRLTGLLNRSALERRAQALLDAQGEVRGQARGGAEGAARDGAEGEAPGDVAGVLCHLDLDRFDIVNDSCGHAGGDHLLVQAADVLRAGLRRTDVLARTSGDKFALVLAGCSMADAIPLARSLVREVAACRFEWEGRVHRLTASAGLAPLAAGQPLSAAVAMASLACGVAKEGGGNRVKSPDGSDVSLHERRRQMGWVARIQQALADERFVLFIQPIVPIVQNVRDVPERPHGEILLRLLEPDGSVLAPGAFIPAAERFRQMQGVDRYVVRKSFDWLVATPGVEASINISGQSFGDPEFLADVLLRFDSTGLDPERVCFELTETAAMDDMAAALVFIQTLKDRGAKFALDDFGAGLSSFSYLRKLPVDVLKIDGSFVRGLAADPVNQAIVESIHRVGKLCRMKTVGEWVEDEATLDALRTIGVDRAQGWGVGRPVPVGDWAEAAGG